MKSPNSIYIPEWTDANTPITLSDLKKLIGVLKRKYGARAVIEFDAGHNNVVPIITPSKKCLGK